MFLLGAQYCFESKGRLKANV